MTRAQHGQRRLHVRVWHAGVPQVQTRLCRGAQVVAGHGRQAQPELTGDASAVRIVGFRGSPIGAAQEVIQGHCGIVQVDELHVHPCEQILGSQATFRRTRLVEVEEDDELAPLQHLCAALPSTRYSPLRCRKTLHIVPAASSSPPLETLNLLFYILFPNYGPKLAL
jgi:hypothetical protein